jgi:hypothetical protein
MSGDKHEVNGNSGKGDDVEMKDSGSSKKSGKGRDGDDEMTVVVPPSKNGKTVDSNGEDKVDETEQEVPIDPKEKAINGRKACIRVCASSANRTRNQEQLRLTRTSSDPIRPSIQSTSFAINTVRASAIIS